MSNECEAKTSLGDVGSKDVVGASTGAMTENDTVELLVTKLTDLDRETDGSAELLFLIVKTEDVNMEDDLLTDIANVDNRGRVESCNSVMSFTEVEVCEILR